MKEKTVLIDGDSLIYFEMGKPSFEEAMMGIDDRIKAILEAFETKSFAGFLTSGKCFRYDRATTRPYKGNRKYGDKPVIFPAIKEYLRQQYNFSSFHQLEADDLVAVYREDCDNPVIASPDKDVLCQIPGTHFNYRTAEMIETSEADAERFLWKQMLMGDSTDGIIGIPKVGEKTAEKWLSELEKDPRYGSMPEFVVRKYVEKFGNWEGIHRFAETFKLVYILKTKEEAYKETELPLPNLIITELETTKNEDELWG